MTRRHRDRASCVLRQMSRVERRTEAAGRGFRVAAERSAERSVERSAERSAAAELSAERSAERSAECSRWSVVCQHTPKK